MGAVTFGVPRELAAALVRAGGLRYAVETGTYLGDSALFLADLVDQVYTIEFDSGLYRRALERTSRCARITALEGFSTDVLPRLRDLVDTPALFWLDGHGGTFGGNDLPSGFVECPVLDEIECIDSFEGAEASCIMIDDARAFFGPLLQHKPEEWPSFIEVADRLRRVHDRYVTALDDVVIAVPQGLRPVVDTWWQDRLRERDNLEALRYELTRAQNPGPVIAAKRLARSIAPRPVRDRYTRWRMSRTAE